MSSKAEEYNNFFTETYTVFKRVSSYAIILEKYSPTGKVLVASINELRAVLFHLYKFIEIGEDQKERLTIDYIEAKEHLYRTYFDLFTKCYAVLTDKIHNHQAQFGVDTMISVCPDYYGVMFPGISKMKREIAEIRVTRDITKAISDHSNNDKNHAIISQLLDWVEQLDGCVLGFHLKQKADKKKQFSNLLIALASATIGAIIGVILTIIIKDGT